MSTSATTPALLPMRATPAESTAGLPGAAPAGPYAGATAFLELLAAALGGRASTDTAQAEQPAGEESSAPGERRAGDHLVDQAAMQPTPIGPIVSAPPSPAASAAAGADLAPSEEETATRTMPPTAPASVATSAVPAPLATPAGLDEAVEAIAAGIRTLAVASARTSEPIARGASLDGLDPTFRNALERTIARMTAEGHTVRVVETSRTQVRQDELYEQGRTTPGPVVTWTRRSRHLVGRAADLQVDGGWSGAGYSRLQAIAREEGLHTLGARDPGHVELRRVATDAASGATSGTPSSTVAGATHPTPVITGASMPEGQGARVAPNGRNAAWSHPGFAAGLLRGRTPAMRSSESASPPVRPSTAAGMSPAVETALREAMELQPALGTEPSRAERAVLDRPTLSSQPQSATPAVGVDIGGWSQEAPTVHTLLTHRIDQLLAAREQVRAQPLAHIAMAIDAANGTTDHVRIGVSNGSLGATILTSDPEAARRMGRDIGGLTEALARSGIDESAVTVRDIGTATGRAAPARQVAEVLDPAAVTAAARTGSLDALRPGSTGGDAGADSRRHERESSQRHGGEQSSHFSGQRDGEQRRQRRDPRQQGLPPNQVFSSLR